MLSTISQTNVNNPPHPIRLPTLPCEMLQFKPYCHSGSCSC